MKKGKTIEAFFANKDILYIFEVWPNFDEETFNKALENESLNSFRLVSSTRKEKFNVLFETDDLSEAIAAIDNIMYQFN